MAIGKRSATAQPTRDAEVTRAKILDAAEDEFARHGLAATRTEDIAARTSVTKAMIYYYFGSKEGLYEAMLERAFSERFRSLQQMNLDELPPERALEAIARWFLTDMMRNTNLPTILFYEGIQNKGKYYKRIGILAVYEKITSVLERGMASGVFRPLDPRHAAVNIVGLCNFYFCARENIKHLWPDRQILGKPMLEEHLSEAVDMVLASVSVGSPYSGQ